MEELTANTWWIDKKNRTWIILSVPFTIYHDAKNVLCFKPAGYVVMLELGKSETIEQPYDLIKEFIESKVFNPLTI